MAIIGTAESYTSDVAGRKLEVFEFSEVPVLNEDLEAEIAADVAPGDMRDFGLGDAHDDAEPDAPVDLEAVTVHELSDSREVSMTPAAFAVLRHFSSIEPKDIESGWHFGLTRTAGIISGVSDQVGMSAEITKGALRQCASQGLLELSMLTNTNQHERIIDARVLELGRVAFGELNDQYSEILASIKTSPISRDTVRVMFDEVLHILEILEEELPEGLEDISVLERADSSDLPKIIRDLSLLQEGLAARIDEELQMRRLLEQQERIEAQIRQEPLQLV